MNDMTRTAATIGVSLPRRSTQLLTGPMFRTAVRDAFVKLDPRLQIRNPVMFVVFLGSILTTALAVAAFAVLVVCFAWVFPALSPHMPFNDTTVGT